MAINEKFGLEGAYHFEKVRFCKKCGCEREWNKPDPCFGKYLEGIAYACCGHGTDKYAYCVGWENCTPNCGPTDRHKKYNPTYWELRGKPAVDHMEKLK